MNLFPSTSTIRAGLLTVLLQALSHPAAAEVPSSPPATFPGEKLGTVEGRWIAPWVYSSSNLVGEHQHERTVRWYDAKGAVIKEISGLKVSSFPDYVTEVLLLGLDMVALDLETGKTVALWEDKKQKPTYGRLMRTGDDLYIVGAMDFFKLNLEDIEAKRHGWK